MCDGSKKAAFNRRVKSIACLPKADPSSEPHEVSNGINGGVLEARYTAKAANITTDTNKWLNSNL